jgi:hypothetical protein
MLRRLALMLRIVLLLVGIALLVWWPISWRHLTLVMSPYPGDGFTALVHEGVIHLHVTRRVEREFKFRIDNTYLVWTEVVRPSAWPSWYFERMSHGSLSIIFIPLWLLAAVCLAWPVTSLLLARRRGKGRGFAVEAGGGGPAPGIDPPPRRPDNIPPP